MFQFSEDCLNLMHIYVPSLQGKLPRAYLDNIDPYQDVQRIVRRKSLKLSKITLFRNAFGAQKCYLFLKILDLEESELRVASHDGVVVQVFWQGQLVDFDGSFELSDHARVVLKKLLVALLPSVEIEGLMSFRLGHYFQVCIGMLRSTSLLASEFFRKSP